MKVIFLIPHVSDGGAEKIASDLSFTLGVDEILLVVFEQRQGYAFQGRLISMDLPIEVRHSLGVNRDAAGPSAGETVEVFLGVDHHEVDVERQLR